MYFIHPDSPISPPIAMLMQMDFHGYLCKRVIVRLLCLQVSTLAKFRHFLSLLTVFVQQHAETLFSAGCYCTRGSGWPGRVTDVLKPYLIRKQGLTVEDGCILWGIRVLIPRCLQEDILTEQGRRSRSGRPGKCRTNNLRACSCKKHAILTLPLRTSA